MPYSGVLVAQAGAFARLDPTPLASTLLSFPPLAFATVSEENAMGANLLLPEHAVSLYRGQSKTLLLRVIKPDPQFPDDPTKFRPFDLTGAALHFTLKKGVKDAIPLVFKSTTSSGFTITSATAGTASISLLPADTKSLAAGRYTYDVWMVVGSDEFPIIPLSTLELLQGATVL